MDKIIERTRFEYPDGSLVNSNAVDVVWNKVKELLTPNLQWKSEEITNDGGDNLLCIQHTLLYTEYRVVINDYGHLCSVIWNSVCLFNGKLEECKKFCTDKVLNDFLKLCE